MRKTPIIAAASGLALLGLAVPASADNHEAKLSVLHGIPDLTVDVYVNGDLTLDDFAPGDLAGPLDLPAGTYSVAITASDAMDDSEPVLGPIDLPLEGGANYTAVAHLTEGGDPTAKLFMNDISATEAGEGRLTVRHVAAAPAVDILAGSDAVITNLANPDEAKLDLPAGTVPAAVAATGTTDPVLGPVDVEIKDGVSTIVYAWGSLEAENLAIAAQEIEGLGSAPHGVPTGQVEVVEQGRNAALLFGAGIALLLGLGATAARAVTVRR
ncbi:MAG: DUF4397 domain-containing protein [Actinomycetes bacterium]|nr:DUF4397 domain-containing protein [Actinomycetes bacterium]MDX5381045.1 DUF4397 domain-containing protein [Actinomycetes bacterium]MDX5400223.1 DUF4397 domain-containing protein [Actinomycetes bacterium]MDX5450799.1 DUF4397 domain-containing protein [Actinomycetes bacterium]